MGNISLQFDYAALDAEARVVVKQKTGEIRDRMKRAASDIVAIGERLIAVKEVLGHGKFGAWLDTEFDWQERTAQKMMGVAEFCRSAHCAELNLPPSALYLLASPSTPPEVRDEVIAAAVAGEKVTHADVKQRVEATRKPDPAPKSLDEQCADENAYLDSMGMGASDDEPRAPKRINIKRDGEDDDVPATVTLERSAQFDDAQSGTDELPPLPPGPTPAEIARKDPALNLGRLIHDLQGGVNSFLLNGTLKSLRSLPSSRRQPLAARLGELVSDLAKLKAELEKA